MVYSFTEVNCYVRRSQFSARSRRPGKKLAAAENAAIRKLQSHSKSECALCTHVYGPIAPTSFRRLIVRRGSNDGVVVGDVPEALGIAAQWSIRAGQELVPHQEHEVGA